MKNLLRDTLWLCLLVHAGTGRTVAAATVNPSWELPPARQVAGIFWREHWYERGASNHNPGYEKRLRVNPPDVVLHDTYGKRIEARENGLMLIPAEEDLSRLLGAELYVETWGGHPGTAGKRVSINGRNTYLLPQVGTEEGHCTYSHPVIPLSLGDLVNGWNACQLALDQGTAFWGHMMVDEACLRVALTHRHPDLARAGLDGFSARVAATVRPDSTRLDLVVSGESAALISRVDFQAWYTGFDENGNRRDADWHGFTRNRLPVGMAGTATNAPFAALWDTSMLPAQKNVAVRALVRFEDAPGLVYVSPASTALTIPDRPTDEVALYYSPDLPTRFWSRASQRKSCSFILDVAPGRIERAELCTVTWAGGSGSVKDYFTLNGHPFPVAEGSPHLPQFSQLTVNPALLRHGTNTIELLSDTEHHGIEVLYPGPALRVRYRR